MADFPFPELEADVRAIDAFVARENARSEAAFAGPRRAADEEALRRILEAPDDIRGLSRRGCFNYAFRRTAENPRGCWMRLPVDVSPAPDAPWQTVFDLDAFCNGTGVAWVWAGNVSSPFDHRQVLLKLSEEGSDLLRLIEFDLASCRIVPGGFDLGPDRGGASWAGPDSLILGSAAPGDATSSGWSGALRRLERGGRASDAPLLCRTDPNNLLVEGWVSRLGGTEWIEVRQHMTEIGMATVTLLRPGCPPVTLPNPSDTDPVFNHAFCAWVANQQGEHASGTLVICRHDGSATRVLFTPQYGIAIRPEDVFFTGDWLVWTEMHWLAPRLMALDTRDPAAAPREIVPPVAAETIWVYHFDAQPDTGDGTLILTATGYLTPSRAWLFDLSCGVDGITFRPLFECPAHFDATGCLVVLWKAVGEDGTEVPYHVVLPKGMRGAATSPCCCTDMAASARASSPVTCRSSARPGSRRAAPMPKPTSAAAASWAPTGTHRRRVQGGTRPSPISPPWRPIWRAAASPRRAASPAMALRTVDCCAA